MATRQIRLYTDEILRKKAKTVKEITPSVITLLDDMEETLKKTSNGIGLAAPQVGILKRIIVIDIGEGPIELINPVILEQRGSQIYDEGCLSLPDQRGYVERPEYVKIETLNREGKKIIVEGEEIMAVVICHEIDHLEGILFIDKVIPDDMVEALPEEE